MPLLLLEYKRTRGAKITLTAISMHWKKLQEARSLKFPAISSLVRFSFRYKCMSRFFFDLHLAKMLLYRLLSRYFSVRSLHQRCFLRDVRACLLLVCAFCSCVFHRSLNTKVISLRYQFRSSFRSFPSYIFLRYVF